MDSLRNALGLVVVFAGTAHAGGAKPSYKVLAEHQSVAVSGPTPTEIMPLRTPVTLTSPGTLFVNSDGSYFPASNPSNTIGNVFIAIDGQLATGEIYPFTRVSNDAVISWDGVNPPVQHSFNVVGAHHLLPGTYTVHLMAELRPNGHPTLGGFFVNGRTNLSVMEPHATAFDEVVLGDDSPPRNDPPYNFTTYSLPDWLKYVTQEPRPIPIILPDVGWEHSTLPGLWFQVGSNAEPVVLLASGRAYWDGGDGDALLGFYVDGFACGNEFTTIAINDLTKIGELQAPMTLQGFLGRNNNLPALPCRDPQFVPVPTAPPHTITLDATELPITPDQPTGCGPWPATPCGQTPVKYHVGAGTRMVYLTGGMNVRGAEPLGHDINNPSDFALAGGFQEPILAGTDVTLVSHPLHIPQGHDGVVFFSTKVRSLGYANSENGIFFLWIEIQDAQAASLGKRPSKVIPHGHVSSLGIQATGSVSQRTLTASYLAAGARALQADHDYIVTVHVRVKGDYAQAAVSSDVPLIFFDDNGPTTCRPDPNCDVDQACGSDGCGGACGFCDALQFCSTNGCESVETFP
jgi:hypothetical protein